MRLSNRADVAVMPRAMTTFFGIVAMAQWKKRVEGFRTEVQKNRFLEYYYSEEFSIELGIYAIIKFKEEHGVFPTSLDNPLFAPAYTFVLTCLQVYFKLSNNGQKRFSGMLRSALTDNGCSSLAFELDTAIHLSAIGFDVLFADIEGAANVDFVATKGPIQFEIECKYISPDKGTQISRKAVPELANLLKDDLVEYANKCNQDTFFHFKLNGRLDVRKERLTELRNAILHQLNICNSRTDLVEVACKPFDIERSPYQNLGRVHLDEDDYSNFNKAEFGIENASTFAYGKATGRVAVVAIESNAATDISRSIYKQMSDATRKQFSGKKPAALFMRLPTVTSQNLLEVCQRQRTGFANHLQIIATDLMSKRPAIHTLAYFTGMEAEVSTTRSEEASIEQKIHSSGGSMYLFVNPEHPKAGDPAYSLTFSGK